MVFYKIILISYLIAGNIFMQNSNERKILIFGKDENALLVQQQLDLFTKEITGINERDIKIILIDKSNLLNEKYAVKAGIFTVLLIGKDGSEKFRTNKLLLPLKLFALVDAMPMRQAEMKKSKHP